MPPMFVVVQLIRPSMYVYEELYFTISSTTHFFMARKLLKLPFNAVERIFREIHLLKSDVMFRKKLWARSSGRPYTTSNPSMSFRINRGISSGGFCKSWSSVTITSPCAHESPASVALCCPKFLLSSMAQTFGSFD